MTGEPSSKSDRLRNPVAGGPLGGEGVDGGKAVLLADDVTQPRERQAQAVAMRADGYRARRRTRCDLRAVERDRVGSATERPGCLRLFLALSMGRSRSMLVWS